MTTFYPSQPTPSFLKKYAKNAYNRAQHEAHYMNGHGSSNEEASLDLQPYRTTPLILPGAKNNLQKNIPTESYLRHHPNPQMRGPPTHDFTDIQMKQKVADTVMHRVVGNQAQNGPQLVHKQFNSPIGLYSDNLIENTIKNTVSQPQYMAQPQSMASQQQYMAPQQSMASPQSMVSPQSMASPGSNQSVPSPRSPSGTFNRPQQQNRPTKIQGYKKTVVYDPLKSETYKYLQENSYAGQPAQEVSAPAQQRVFQPNKLVPGKKPVYHTQESFPPADPMVCSMNRHPVNSMGEATDVIHQSGSFKRLMWHVLGETDY